MQVKKFFSASLPVVMTPKRETARFVCEHKASGEPKGRTSGMAEIRADTEHFFLPAFQVVRKRAPTVFGSAANIRARFSSFVSRDFRRKYGRRPYKKAAHSGIAPLSLG